jgi:hypothetical protein
MLPKTTLALAISIERALVEFLEADARKGVDAVAGREAQAGLDASRARLKALQQMLDDADRAAGTANDA